MVQLPARSASTIFGSLSTHVTRLPTEASIAPLTRPTYPVPITEIRFIRELSSLPQRSAEVRLTLTLCFRGGILDCPPLSIIAAAEVFFHPAVERDEQITAAHLLDFELRDAGPPIPPGDWQCGPGITADDGFERQLDGEIEMRRKEWATAVERAAAVRFERVGQVVERHTEQQAQKEVG